MFRIAYEGSDFREAARLLLDFNAEFDAPVPDSVWFQERLWSLHESGDTKVLLWGSPAICVAVLRFRGNLWSEDLDAEIEELYTVPEQRGRGFGGAFLKAIIEYAERNGASYLHLVTTEGDHGDGNIYCHHGFHREHVGEDGEPLVYYEMTFSKAG